MVKIYYIYGESDYYICGQIFITFMVSHLLHLWLIVVTFMVDFYYIYGWYVVRPHHSINQSTKIEMVSRLVPSLKGEGVKSTKAEGSIRDLVSLFTPYRVHITSFRYNYKLHDPQD